MRTIIAGGRDFTDKDAVWEVLNHLHQERSLTFVITGQAPGVDTLADQWAEWSGIDRMILPANWQAYRRSAGPFRNRLMITLGLPEALVHFPGGPGTANMVKQARQARLELIDAGKLL